MDSAAPTKQPLPTLTGSCEMDDLQIYATDQVAEFFKQFVEITKDTKDSKQILHEFGANLRIKFDNWPTLTQAIDLFNQSLQIGKKRSAKWTDLDKKLFFWVVIRYCLHFKIAGDIQLNPQDWREISKVILGRNAHQCRLKWEQKYKISLQEVPWTQEEDQLLQQIHDHFVQSGKENKWSQIAREIYKRSPTQVFRQPKQCRERWINKLDPKIINEPWTKQEEIELLKMILIRGKKWSELSAIYGRERTENSLKNKFNALLKKEKAKYEFQTINPVLFSKVQKLRQTYSQRYGIITPIEEIDNYEWQFIILAIQSLQVEQLVAQGRFAEAQRLQNNEHFFDLFNTEQQMNIEKQSLNIRKVSLSDLVLENEKSSIVVYNPITKKLFISPYKALEFNDLILQNLYKQVKKEEQIRSSTISNSQHLMRDSFQMNIFPVNSFMMPANSYYMPQIIPTTSANLDRSNQMLPGMKIEAMDLFDDVKHVESDDGEDLDGPKEQTKKKDLQWDLPFFDKQENPLQRSLNNQFPTLN